MNCSEFERFAVADDAVERAEAARHAVSCPRCGAILAGWRALDEEVAAWSAASPAPSSALEQRLLAAFAGKPSASGRLLRFPLAKTSRWLLAAAASLALAAGALLAYRAGSAPPSASQGQLLARQALATAAAAEREHARAIARLESYAEPILAAASDSGLDPERAARLMAYADRLRFLDGGIAEVRAYLEENPYNAHARTILLASYSEKTEVLREVLTFASGGVS